MQGKIFIVLGAVLMTTPAGPSSAQDYETARRWCYGEATPDQTVQGCDVIIRANREPAANIAAAYFNRGLIYHGKGQYGPAIEDYNQAIKSKPAYPEAFYQRGLANRRSDRNDLAMQDYDHALRLKPGYVDVLNSRCYLRAIVGDLQAALQDCNEALRLAPKNQYALDSRAFANLKLGMLDAAITDYNMALQLEPDRPYSLYGRGVAKRKRGDVAGGNADMARAKAKVPGIAEEFAKYGVSAFQ